MPSIQFDETVLTQRNRQVAKAGWDEYLVLTFLYSHCQTSLFAQLHLVRVLGASRPLSRTFSRRVLPLTLGHT